MFGSLILCIPDLHDIGIKLPEPMTTEGLSPTGKQFIFSFDLETFFKLVVMK